MKASRCSPSILAHAFEEKRELLKVNDKMQGSLLGPKFQEKEIKIELDKLEQFTLKLITNH